ncbi:MAG: hypothetical protein ACJAXW_003059 [Candidatus Azotimanducaceae bacterium]|jgi:hypothetical protein
MLVGSVGNMAVVLPIHISYTRALSAHEDSRLSYDLIVFCTKQADECLSSRGFQIESSNWMLSVDGPTYLESEDIPDDIDCLLPGISAQYELNLTLDAPDSSYKKLHSTAKSLAKACDGLVYDPQLDKVIFPRKISRYKPSRKPKTDENDPVKVVTLGFWFLGTTLDSREEVANLVLSLQHLIPETIPKRYGTYEPFQGNLERNGLNHYIDVFHYNSNRRSLFGTYTKPVYDIDLKYKPNSWSLDLFECNFFSIRILADCLNAAGWCAQIERTFTELIVLLNPFYAEINVPNGKFGPRRQTCFRGLPKIPKYGVYYGKQYQDQLTEIGNLKAFHHGLLWIDLEQENVSPQIQFNPEAGSTLSFWDGTMDTKVDIFQYPRQFPFPKETIDWEGNRGQIVSSVLKITGDHNTRHGSYNPNLVRLPVLHHRDTSNTNISLKREIFIIKQSLLSEFGSKFRPDDLNDRSLKWSKGEDEAAYITIVKLFEMLKDLDLDLHSSPQASYHRDVLVLEVNSLMAMLLCNRRPLEGVLFLEIYEWPTMYQNSQFLYHSQRAAKTTQRTMKNWLLTVLENESAEIDYRIGAAEVLATQMPDTCIEFMHHCMDNLPPKNLVFLEGLVEKVGSQLDKNLFYSESTMYWKSVMDWGK